MEQSKQSMMPQFEGHPFLAYMISHFRILEWLIGIKKGQLEWVEESV